MFQILTIIIAKAKSKTSQERENEMTMVSVNSNDAVLMATNLVYFILKIAI